MWAYLCFIERSQNSLSLLCCALYLILHHFQSVELMFCCGGLCGVLVCCLSSMDEMLIHFSLVFDRWMTTPTQPSELMDGSVATGCTTLVFPRCFKMCCTALAKQGPPRTVVIRTINSGLGTARSTWTSWLTTLTRP
jgi:hypothetical protein